MVAFVDDMFVKSQEREAHAADLADTLDTVRK